MSSAALLQDVRALIAPGVPFVRHPLGFAYHRLREGETGAYMRLHVWTRQTVPVSTPHTHSSDLWSWVLGGTLTNENWRLVRSAEHLTPVCDVAHSHGARTAQDRRLVPLVQDGVSVVSAGSSYKVPVGRFHASYCTTEICVTLVLRAPPAGRLATVAGLESGPHKARVAAPLATAELAAIHQLLTPDESPP